jgi:hypothetical protein
MFLLTSGKIFDLDLNTLKEILQVLDDQIERLNREAENCLDADAESLGIYDRAEATIGLGFVACQQYLTATYGFLKVKKDAALAAGPTHEDSGMYFAQIVHHAANFWKHHEEWQIEGSPHPKTAEAFQKLGLDTRASYVLSNVLAKIASPTGFRSLLPQLEKWRDALRVSNREHR